MKKLDKLILSSFIGPFIMTFLVVVFILLTQHMLKYFDDIIGKDLGWDVVGQLLFYFAIFMSPVALPLAVLLSSLITFGNLGEHFELTAIKSAGISLLRTIRPIFFFVLILTAIAFYINNNLVPRAALEAYSLLWDIKQKKPALDLREGTFYNGLPNVSIKVNHKDPDGITLKDIIVYDHRKNDGNKEVTIADSGRMSTILNDRYLKFELFNGYNYTEGASSEREMTGQKHNRTETFTRSQFYKTQVVFDLSSFQLERTDKKWFESNRIMRNIGELNVDIDSINRELLTQELNHYLYRSTYFSFYDKDKDKLPPHLEAFKRERDSLNMLKYRPKDPDRAESLVAEEVESRIAESDSISEPQGSVGIEETDTLAESAESVPTQREEKGSTRLERPSRGTSEPAKLPRPSPGNSMRSAKPARPSIAASELSGSDSSSSDTSMPLKLARPSELAAVEATARADSDSVANAKLDSLLALPDKHYIIQSATNMARQVKSQVQNSNRAIAEAEKDKIVFEIQWHKIIANSLMCIAMFLIGAPLGAIIKRGGLGIPFLISIFFFIVYYVLNMQGEKMAKQGLVSPAVGIWAADFILLIIGLIFLRQARVDARLFEADAYRVFFDKVKKALSTPKVQSKPAT